MQILLFLAGEILVSTIINEYYNHIGLDKKQKTAYQLLSSVVGFLL